MRPMWRLVDAGRSVGGTGRKSLKIKKQMTHRLVVAEPVGMALVFLLLRELFPLHARLLLVPQPHVPHQIVLPGPHFHVFLLVVPHQVLLHHIHERDVHGDVHVTRALPPRIRHLGSGFGFEFGFVSWFGFEVGVRGWAGSAHSLLSTRTYPHKTHKPTDLEKGEHEKMEVH